MSTTHQRVASAFAAALASASLATCHAPLVFGPSVAWWTAQPRGGATYVGLRRGADATAAFGGSHGPDARGAIVAEQGGDCAGLERECPRVAPNDPAGRVAEQRGVDCAALEARCPEPVRRLLARPAGGRAVLLVEHGAAREVTAADFGAAFGPVDSVEKAAMLVWLSGYELSWHDATRAQHEPQARRVPEGFEVWGMMRQRSCGGPTGFVGSWSERVLLRVSPAGALSERERTEFDRSANADACRPMGRRPEGLCARDFGDDVPGWFARAAYLEAASVLAFARMDLELARFGAPGALRARARRAARDERRHARTMASFVRRFGGVAARPRARSARGRTLEDFAVENAVEGCVFESFAAASAMHQSLHAADREVRAAMASIARDEVRHCALALDVDAWARTRLDGAASARVAHAREGALARLRGSLIDTDAQPEVSRWLGEPAGAPAWRLADAVARCARPV